MRPTEVVKSSDPNAKKHMKMAYSLERAVSADMSRKISISNQIITDLLSHSIFFLLFLFFISFFL